MFPFLPHAEIITRNQLKIRLHCYKSWGLFRHPGWVPPDQSIPMTEEIFDISNRTIQQQCRKRIFPTKSDFSNDFPILILNFSHHFGWFPLLISNFSDGILVFLTIFVTNIKFYRRNRAFPTISDEFPSLISNFSDDIQIFPIVYFAWRQLQRIGDLYLLVCTSLQYIYNWPCFKKAFLDT